MIAVPGSTAPPMRSGPNRRLSPKAAVRVRDTTWFRGLVAPASGCLRRAEPPLSSNSSANAHPVLRDQALPGEHGPRRGGGSDLRRQAPTGGPYLAPIPTAAILEN